MVKEKYTVDAKGRLHHTHEFLRNMPDENLSVLDLGSRDASALAPLRLKSGVKLVATDKHNRMENGIDFVAHDLENALPFGDSSFDVVICTDVIEHVERKHQLISEIGRVTRKWTVVSLPNTQHYRYVEGLKKGNMGKQYIFDVPDGSDRHRWVTFYDDNIAFVSRYFDIHKRIDICRKSRDVFFARIKPNKYVINQWFSLLKK